MIYLWDRMQIVRSKIARKGAPDAFVCNAEEIWGLSAKELAEKLKIDLPPNGFDIYVMPGSEVEPIASPINRSYPEFVPGGRTGGGASEFVIRNGPWPATTFKLSIPGK